MDNFRWKYFNPREMSHQAIFDTAMDHMIAQGKRSMDMGGSCQYRSPTGSQCAMGIFISDEEYEPEFDGVEGYSCSLSGLKIAERFTNPIAPKTLTLLMGLQLLHDYQWEDNPEYLIRGAIKLAVAHKLVCKYAVPVGSM